MVHDAGRKGDSSGYPTCDGGSPGSQGEEIRGGGGHNSRGVLWIDRGESRRLSRVLCMKVCRQDWRDTFRGTQESKQARLAGTEGMSSSLVRFEAGNVGEGLAVDWLERPASKAP